MSTRSGWTSRGQRIVAGGALAVGGVLLAVQAAGAASVAPVPFQGPTSCAALHARFGVDQPAWVEIRFSDMEAIAGSKSATAKGVTATVTRTGPTTFSWHATAGIDLVWVNAGKPPKATSAAYRYPSEATGDSGLSGTTGQDPLDHVLLCFDLDEAPTTTAGGGGASDTTPAPATTEAPPTSEAPATTAGPATTMTPTVRSMPVVTPVATTSLANTPKPTVRDVVVTAAPALPETGAGTGLLVGLGAALVLAGVASMVLVRRSPDEA